MTPTWLGRPHTPLSRATATLLRLLGWQVVLEPPPGVKIVAAGAPHTSNADFWAGLLWKWATRSPVHFVGKRELFKFPMGIFMRAVGGIPLDRGKIKANFVGAVVEVIRREEEIVLIVAPEGSRGYSPYWKTGFYYMARQADVPIGVLALDWGRRRVGLVGYVTPTGDIEADFQKIAALLEGVEGRKPQNQGPVLPRPREV